MHKILLIIFVVPILASGGVLEPIEKRTLTPVDSAQFRPGLCPGNTAVPLGALAAPSLPHMEEVKRHQLAMVSATAIYSLPDLESASSGAALVEKMKVFLTTLPSGYDFYFYFVEPASGMKYLIFSPKVKNQPWILAIAGTQSALDWLVNIDLGRGQLDKLVSAIGLFTSCQYLDPEGQPLPSHEWIIAGHSLGGGLAQALGYKIQSRRLEKGLLPINMEVVTFNGFGGKELVEKTETYNAAFGEWIHATNYFVHGEPVSCIGTHIGRTLQLTPAGEDPSTSSCKFVGRHGMATVTELFNTTPLERAPPHFGFLRSFLKIRFKEFIADEIYKNRYDRIIQILKEASEVPTSPVVRAYLQRLTFSQLYVMNGDDVLAQARAAELKAILRSFR